MLLARKTLMTGLALAMSLGLLGGCASVPMADSAADSRAKQFVAPKNGNASLYIYRNSMLGAALSREVKLDGASVGKTANKTYFYKEIAPGSHTLTSEGGSSDNRVILNAEPGKTYFVRQFITMGLLSGGSGVEMVSEAEGRSGVAECKLALGDGTAPALPVNVTPVAQRPVNQAAIVTEIVAMPVERAPETIRAQSQSAPVQAEPSTVAPAPAPAASRQPTTPLPAASKRQRPSKGGDLRKCLERSNNLDIARCAGEMK
ncbi:DUF2846 domain-containing protein [Burkholderiaceae bacterium DAT-1]|nr:DUF2846 domain-containing protein [Burkholderiaceae bacterium DAT-1]